MSELGLRILGFRVAGFRFWNSGFGPRLQDLPVCRSTAGSPREGFRGFGFGA